MACKYVTIMLENRKMHNTICQGKSVLTNQEIVVDSHSCILLCCYTEFYFLIQ